MDKLAEAKDTGPEPPKSANDFLAAVKYVAETHGVRLAQLEFTTVEGMRCTWHEWGSAGDAPF